jgi:YHS domain-containing protein
MYKLKILIAISAIPMLIHLSFYDSTATDESQPQTTCPVLRQGMPCEITKEIYTDYKGKRIYACSQGCLDEFKRNPEKHIKLLEDQGVILDEVPPEKP